MKKLVIAAAIFMTGCAVAENTPCEFSYQVDPELSSAAQEAASRWAKATGCEISVDGGPRRIDAVDYLSNGGDGQARAATSDGGMLIRIHRRSPDIYRSMMHEIGHSLGMTGHNSGHGVLSYRKDYVAIIDEMSLSDVCDRISCQVFQPEGEPLTPVTAAD